MRETITKLIDFIEKSLSLSASTQQKIFLSIVIVLVIWLIRVFVLRLLWRKTDNAKSRYIWGKTLGYIAAFFSIIALGMIWLRNFNHLETYLGLLSAGIAIALKDPLVNLTGWLFLILRRPFEVGDRVQIGQSGGDVIDIRVFQFTVLEIGGWVDADQSTGRIIHIPNGKLFTESIANYNRGFEYIWDEIAITITFESNWKDAKTILSQIANRHSENLSQKAAKSVKEASKRFMIFYSHLSSTVYTSIKDNGICLTIRYLCEPRQRRGRREAIWEEVLNEFAKRKDIDFAYPTLRMYNNTTESKQNERQETT